MNRKIRRIIQKANRRKLAKKIGRAEKGEGKWIDLNQFNPMP